MTARTITRIAVYARKSRLTDSGDSVENQIKLCGEYIRSRQSPDADIRVYQDEGFSGGNVDRPQFKLLQSDIKKGEIDMIVCYRLDRVSRNVMDFSAFLDGLQDRDIGFVSLRENFDTTTPMGRAMIYISSVFAQLERETIAERVRDNLFELAKTKRHISPKAPEGYKRVKVESGGKYHFELAAEPSEFDKIKEIFGKYLQWRSIHKIQAWSMNERVYTRSGKYYKCGAVRKILTHPVYCAADAFAYEYFSGLGCQIFSRPEEWNGAFGVSIFRHWDADKGERKGVFVRDPSEWVIGVGTQPPMIPSRDWVRAQEYVRGQKRAAVPRPYGGRGILSGTLKCGKCGRSMRSAAGLGDRYFYYACNGKADSHGLLCDMKNVRGDILDEETMKRLRDIIGYPSAGDVTDMESYISQTAKPRDTEAITAALNAEIGGNNALITGFLRRLALTEDENMARLITEQIEALQAENAATEREIDELSKQSAEQAAITATDDAAKKLLSGESLDAATRRNLLRHVVKSAVWTGESLMLELFS